MFIGYDYTKFSIDGKLTLQLHDRLLIKINKLVHSLNVKYRLVRGLETNQYQ